MIELFDRGVFVVVRELLIVKLIISVSQSANREGKTQITPKKRCDNKRLVVREITASSAYKVTVAGSESPTW